MNKLLLLLMLGVSFIVQGQNLTFSVERGFYDAPFQLAISTDLGGGAIRYTTDGSPPTTTNGLIYSGEITISTTSVIRAIAYAGANSTPVITHTYLFLNDVINQPATIPGWPNNVYDLGSGNAQATHDYEMDPLVVNDPAYSSVIIDGMKAIPTMSIVMDKNKFLDMYDGTAAEATSVEVLYPDQPGQSEQFNIGVESHSHLRLKRSFKLVIEAPYSEGINSNLFKKGPLNGANAATHFEETKIILRGGNNRSWARNWNPDRTTYTRDEWLRASQLAVSGIGKRGTFVHLYVNGLYWGLYNPVERQDAGFMVEYFGGVFDDWMTLNHGGVRSGDDTRYQYLVNTLINEDMTVAANYEEAKQYIDPEKFCDYLIVTWMTGTTDWPNNNFYGGNRNTPPEPFMYYCWDGEWSWDTTNGSSEGGWVHPQFVNTATGEGAIDKIWHSLRRNDQFMQLFADRVYKHCFNGGPLSDAASIARWTTLNNFIETAIIGESARWGDALEDGRRRTKNDDWTPEVNRLAGLMNGNVDRFIQALIEEGYYSTLEAPAFNNEGGSVVTGFELIITNPNSQGQIYYTIDGSDPRTAEGALSSSAILYTGPLVVNDNLTLNARIKNNNEWSALHQAGYAPLSLYINEFLASNGTGITDEGGVFEDWIEIYNGGSQPANIGGMYITDNLLDLTKWQIPDTDPTATTIPAGGHLLLWADNQPEEGVLHVNIKLGASGEQIGLSHLSGGSVEILDSLTFGPQVSDVSFGRFPDGDPLFREFTSPTPGLPNELPFEGSLYINEFLASNGTGITDESGVFEDWVEIYNAGDEAVDIGGLYITDDLTNPTKWQIPTTDPGLTTIPAKGFLVLWADNQPEEGPLHVNIKLSAGGEQLGLVEVIGADIGFLDSLTFTTQLTDVSTGRFPDGSETLKAFYAPTPGSSNIIPFVSNLWINEIQPINNTSITDEFGENDSWIEIYNNNEEAVDIGGLFLSNDINNLSLWQIPSGQAAATTIPAKSFITLWADNQTAQGPLHLGFTLNPSGGEVVMTDILGIDFSIVDTINYASQVADVSYGRYPDAAANFKSFTDPTPGAANTLPILSQLFINEFLASNDAGIIDDFGELEDWVEIYNGGSQAVDIGGLFITDDINNPTKHQMPSDQPGLTTIPAGGFLLIWADNQPQQGALHADIKLSASGEQIALIQINGTALHFLDSLSFGPQQTDVSVGRFVDGGAEFISFSTPTPNATNNSSSAAPVISNCPLDITVETSAGVCEAVASWTEPTASDDGTVVSFISTHDPGAIFLKGVTTVVYTATDNEGNSATCSFNITVNDTEFPEINCPAPITVTEASGGAGTIVNYTTPVGTDNCPGFNTIQTTGLGDGGSFPLGVTTETYLVTDAAGNSSSCSFTITVETSSSNPIITGCPTNITQGTDANVCEAVVTWIEPVASDDGTVVSFISTHTPGAVFPVGLTTVTYTATDNDGNISECSFDILINDTAFPIVSCPATINVNVEQGIPDIVVNYTPPVGTDNCSGVNTVQTTGLGSGSSFPVGATTEAYTVTDAAGNATGCSFTVNVIEVGPPIISGCPSNISQGTAAGLCEAVVSWIAPTASDEGTVVSFTSTHTPGTAFPVGTTTVTYTATDDDGNTAECSFDVTVNDTELPQISCPAAIVVTAAPNAANAIVNYTAPVGTDNCSGVLTSQTAGLGSGSSFPIGTTTETFTVTDAATNTASCSFTVTVNAANVGPTIQSFVLVDANTDQDVIVLTEGKKLVLGDLPNTYLNIYTTTSPSPTGSVLLTISGALTNSRTENVAPYALFGDNGGNFNGESFGLGQYTVTAQAFSGSSGSGEAGPLATVNFEIVEFFTGEPEISGCPVNISSGNASGNCSAQVSWTPPVASDTDGTIVSFVSSHAPGSVFPVGTTTVTYTATDNDGNISSCSFDVTISDTESPQISCPANITVFGASGAASAVVTYAAPIGTDNCTGVSTVQTGGLGSGSSFPIGTTTETYTVTDAAANATSCSFTVTVIETGPPIISGCPSNISQGTDAGVCEAVVSWIAPTASDEGTVVSFTSTHTPGTAFPVGTTTVTYTATDNDGNSSECSFDVTISDTESPQISCPTNITAIGASGATSAVVTYAAPIGTDNCSGVSTVQTGGLGSGSSFPVGTTTETYTVTDAAANATSCSFTVTVIATGPPVISGCPSNITQGTDAGVCEAVVSWTAPSASDEGTVVSFTSTHTPGTAFPVGTTTVTYTATDNDGNSSECSFDVTISDTESPQISCPTNITAIGASGATSAVVTYAAPIGTDNCSGVSTVQTGGLGSGSSFPVGTTTETYTVTDAAANATSCSFTVTVIAAGPPIISGCPSNISQGTAAGLCEAVVSWIAPTASDEGTVVSFTSTHTPGTAFPVGTTTVTYTATDNDGNTAECSFDVTVNDTELPQISCPAAIVVTAAPNAANAIVNYTAPVGTDNCSGVSTSQTAGLGSGSSFPIGTTTETFTVTDAATNTASCSFTVTVNAANVGPTIQSFVLVDANTDQDVIVLTEGKKLVLGDLPNTYLNIYTTTSPSPTGSVLLTISGALTNSRTENVAPYALFGDNGGNFNGESFGLGQYTVTAQAFSGSSGSGEAGPLATVNFEIVEFFTGEPEISGCPVNISSGNASGNCSAQVSWTPPVASDTDGTIVSFVSSHAPGSVFPVGTTTVTYTATDNDGNISSCSFDVTISDTESPQISCPANITVFGASGAASAVVTYAAPIGTDNCTGVSTVQTGGLGSGSSFPIGTTTETYTVTDAAANATSCSFTVTVIETGPPIISGCPSNISQGTDAGVCEAVVSWIAPTASDEGTVVSFTSTHTPGTAFPVGTTTVTYTATDNDGNSSECSFDVTISDTESPQISCPTNITAIGASGATSAVVTYAAPIGTDNCSGVSTVQTGGLGSGSSFPIGTTTETYTVTDAAANATSCSFTVTVIATGPPVISGCPSNITQGTDAGVCEAVVTWVAPTASDEGTVVSFTSTHTPGTAFPVGTTTVTYTATDNDGNSSECSFDVTISDTESPQISCPTNITAIGASGATSAVVTYAAPIGTDNCTGVSTVQTGGLGSGSSFPIGTTTETYTVTDAAANATSCSFTVTVIAAGPPVISGCPSNISQGTAAGLCEAVVTWIAPTASDEGTVVSFTSTHTPGTAFPVGTTTVTYTATDNDGNTAECSFDVTVNDTELPQISCPAAIVVTAAPNAANAIVNYTAPVGTDNCSGVSTSQTAGLGSGSSFPIGTTTETFTVTDAATNTAPCSFTVTVNAANVGPTIQSFVLVDAATDQDIIILTDGAKLVLGDLPNTYLNIYATTNPLPTGSVVLNISGALSIGRTENVAPYALLGDNGGNFNGETFGLGLYTLTAQAFTGSGGSGNAGPALSISFEIVATNNGALVSNSTNIESITQVLDHSSSDKDQSGNRLPAISQSQIRSGKDILLYPNPANELLNIDLSALAGKSANLLIFNQMGQVVWLKEIEEIGYDPLQITLTNSAFSDGVFLLQVKTADDQLIIRRFLVNRR
ncbi:MAG: HYR domain-containing protein [Saprospiraceae bacterium]